MAGFKAPPGRTAGGMPAEGTTVESDIRYYRRRACEEMSAATRAVTEEARERRLRLVDLYVRKLEELKATPPFSQHDLAHARAPERERTFA
jgi:hypothetical protein